MSTLTRLYLNRAKRGAVKLLSNPQAMHAAVRSAFPPDIDESTTRVLWRVDTHGEETRLYIVGPEQPDTSHLVEQAGWNSRPGQSLSYDNLLDKLATGQRWRFELTANPVESHKVDGKSRGVVRPHVTAEQQLAWLLKKAASAGFAIAPDSQGQPQLQVVARADLRFAKKSQAKPISLRTARFRGVLEITDAELFRTTIQQGFGRAKAYGCGLITLAPITAGQD